MLSIPVPIGVNRLISASLRSQDCHPALVPRSFKYRQDRERAGPVVPLAFARQCAPAILVRFARALLAWSRLPP
jgi:hypothetical protein